MNIQGSNRGKKLFTIILLIILFFALFGIGYVYSTFNTVDKNSTFGFLMKRDVYGDNSILVNTRATSLAENLVVPDGNIPLSNVTLEQGQKGLLFDLQSKKPLFAQNVYEKAYPASVTKIMTGMLALKHGNLNQMVTITDSDLNLEPGSQTCGFVPGDQLSLDQLLHCLLVYSGNDAANAIARTVGGSEENFVQMMNDYAKELGCTGTHFQNPHGLHKEDHFTTAYDIYLMLNEAYTKYPKFTEITDLPNYGTTFMGADGQEKSINLTATDHFLTGESSTPKDVTVLGGKTGTTDQAGNCLAIVAQNAYGKPFVSIMLKASTKEELYKEQFAMLENINK